MRRAERATHHRRIPDDLLPSAVYGSFDALNGVVGLVAGLLAAHARETTVLSAVVAAGGANTWSMAGAEYVCDEDGSRADRWRRCVTMAVAFLAVSLAPPVGFFFSRTAGKVTMLVLTPLILVGITSVRARFHGWRRASLTVGVIFAGASLTAYGAALVS